MTAFRSRLHEIIFGHDTWEGKLFDIVLLWCILASVFVVMLESVQNIRVAYGPLLRGVEWFFTILFTVEYVTRLVASRARDVTPSASTASSTCWPS